MTGIFTGSFDPYTIGHDDILRRALPLFDHIVIGIGVNERKSYMQSAEERMKTIKAIYADEPKVEVKTYNDLTIDFARRENASYIIKGVRSVKDFEYERDQARRHRRISWVGIEQQCFYARQLPVDVSLVGLIFKVFY